MIRYLTFFFTLFLLASCSAKPPLVVSVIGTNDVHGQLVENGDRGGLVNISAYVAAIRDERAQDDGAALLIDAGDMWQGTLESNLSEGAAMISAYNALGYAAATIGNHEFDFGPRGAAATPSEPGHDPRGALKERAREAKFPLLAANLIDTSTGDLVDWENVQPSILIDLGDIKVGVIGVMSLGALQATIALNVGGLDVAPLVPAIQTQAEELRNAGATLIIVTAHAGGRCGDFDDPYDLSSCREASEIFRVANALPAGLVDHIIAGHVHEGIAHIVNGTVITSSYSNTRAFSRVDFFIDRSSGAVLKKKVFPPQATTNNSGYTVESLQPNPAVLSIANEAVQFAREIREAKIGIRLDTPFTLKGGPESALGNLFTNALYESLDVDVAIHNVLGGLRTELAAGDLQFGTVYELSPFENRAVIIELLGSELRRVVAEQAYRGERSVGFTGMTVSVACSDSNMHVAIELANGEIVSDDDVVTVAVNDYIATGGDNVMTSIMPAGGYAIDNTGPLVRDLFVEWLSARGGSIREEEFDTRQYPKWDRPQDMSTACPLN
jgi:5'-nucleotidase